MQLDLSRHSCCSYTHRDTFQAAARTLCNLGPAACKAGAAERAAAFAKTSLIAQARAHGLHNGVHGPLSGQDRNLPARFCRSQLALSSRYLARCTFALAVSGLPPWSSRISASFSSCAASESSSSGDCIVQKELVLPELEWRHCQSICKLLPIKFLRLAGC